MTERPYARIWLYLLKNGGWHEAGDLITQVRLVNRNPYAVIAQMHTQGYIQKRTGEDGKFQYGVTSSCVVPRLLSVGQVAEALTN